MAINSEFMAIEIPDALVRKYSKTVCRGWESMQDPILRVN